jgi:hypothetical protein
MRLFISEHQLQSGIGAMTEPEIYLLWASFKRYIEHRGQSFRVYSGGLATERLLQKLTAAA